MTIKRSRAFILLPIGLIAMLGMMMLGAAAFGNSPVAARSNSTLGALALRGHNLGVLKGTASGALLQKVDAFNAASLAQQAGGIGKPNLRAFNGGLLGGLPSNTAARANAQGITDDILAAVDETSAASSYDFVYNIVDPDSGPVDGEGQYVAPDRAHVTATDQDGNEREAIIFGENYYVLNDEGEWELKTRDELDEDTVPANSIITSVADSPNVFESLAGLMFTATNFEDQGEVELAGATTRHYTFDMDGATFVGEDAEPYIFGSGEIFVELSSSRVYAISYDIDLARFIEALFGPSTETPTPGPTATPEPVVHLIYNLRLSNFDAEQGFSEPDVQANTETAEPTSTRARTTRTAVATRTSAAPTNTRAPRRTPTATATSTAVSGVPADVNAAIGDAIDVTLNELSSFHFALDTGYNQIDSDGNTYNSHTTAEADVENPDSLDMTIVEEVSDNGDDSVYNTHFIRLGDDVYQNSEQTQGKWELYSIDDIGQDNLATVIDPRSVLATAEQVDDEEIDGINTHHYVFTFDLQKLFGEDADLTGLDSDGGGDVWIAEDGGQLVSMRYSYYLENPDTGAMLEAVWQGDYSAFDEPVSIIPPNTDETDRGSGEN